MSVPVPIRRRDGGRYKIWPDNLPPDIDWTRADWATRDRTQQQWRKWWDEEGRWTLTTIHSDRLATPQPNP